MARVDYVTVPSTAAIFEVLARMRSARASVAVVLRSGAADPRGGNGSVLGVVTKAHLMDALAEGMELFGD